MNPRTFSLRHVVLLLVLLVLGGCGSNDEPVAPIPVPSTPVTPAPPAPVVTVSGGVVKGPVSGATVNLFAVDSSGAKTGDPIATAITDANGEYTADLGDFTGVYLVEASGGAYLDEATGKTRTISAASPLRAVSSVVQVTEDSVITASITPLTEIAVQVALKKTGGLTAANVDASNTEVGALFFGTTDDAASKLLTVRPADATRESSTTKTDEERLYGLLLAMISELEVDAGSLLAAVTLLADDISANSNIAASSAALGVAADRFIAGPSNNSGIRTASPIRNLVDAAATGVGTAVASSTAADIIAFRFDDTLKSTINNETREISLLQPAGSDLASLQSPTIALSLGSTVAVSGTASFSSPVTYVVTAADVTTTREWTVVATTAASELSSLADISGISTGVPGDVIINRVKRSVVGSVPTLADLLALDELDNPAGAFSLSPDASADLVSGKFASGDVILAVTAEDGTRTEWQVIIRVDQPASQPALRITNEPLTLTTRSEAFDVATEGGIASARVTFSSSDTAVLTVDATTGVLTVQGPGTATITATKAAVATDLVKSYLAAETSIEVTVAKAEQATLAWVQPSLSATLGGTAVNSLAGGSGTGSLNFASSAETVATISADGVLALVGTGTTTISATKAGDEDYLDSNTASYELTVAAASTPPPEAPDCVFGESNLDECELR